MIKSLMRFFGGSGCPHSKHHREHRLNYKAPPPTEVFKELVVDGECILGIFGEERTPKDNLCLRIKRPKPNGSKFWVVAIGNQRL